MPSITWGFPATEARVHRRDSVDHALGTAIDRTLAAERLDLVADLVENARATTITPHAAVHSARSRPGSRPRHRRWGRLAKRVPWSPT